MGGSKGKAALICSDNALLLGFLLEHGKRILKVAVKDFNGRHP